MAETGGRDQDLELLAPDDHTADAIWIDIGRDPIHLAAFEGPEPTQVDRLAGVEIGAARDLLPVDQIDVETRPWPDREIGLEVNQPLAVLALQDGNAAAAPVNRVLRVGVDESAGLDYRLRLRLGDRRVFTPVCAWMAARRLSSFD